MEELIDFTELKAAGLLPAPGKDTLELLGVVASSDSYAAQAAAIAGRPALEGALTLLAGKRDTLPAALPETLAALGPYPLRQLAVALDLCGQYRRGACQDFDYLRFWSRALASACAAQALAAEMPVATGSELFCQGLLADIGQLALATARPRSYARLMRECASAGADGLLRKEAALYGYNHLSLGAAMLRHWQMGNVFSDAVLRKDAPHMAADRHARHLARVLQLAGCMADLLLAPPDEHSQLVDCMALVSERMQLSTATLLDIVDEANAHWRRWCDLLELPGPHAMQQPLPAAAALNA